MLILGANSAASHAKVGEVNRTGNDTIAVYNAHTAMFYLRNSNTTGAADITALYGNPGWTPLAGNWNGR